MLTLSVPKWLTSSRRLVVEKHGILYPFGLRRAYSEGNLEKLLAEIGSFAEQKLFSVSKDDVLSVLQFNRFSEGDELNPNEYRSDWEDDGRSALVVGNLKLWFTPSDRLEFADCFR